MKLNNLKTKILFIVAGLSTITILGLYFFMSTSIKMSYLKLEDDQVANDMARVQEALSEMVANIESKASDWSHWDDPYFFVQGKHPKFIEQNYSPADQSSKLLQTDFQIFLNNKNEVIFSSCWGLEEDKKCEIPEDLMASLKAEAPESVYSGIVAHAGGASMVTAQILLKSDGTGTSSGRLVFGRFIDSLVIQRLSELTKLKMEIYFDPQKVFVNNQFPKTYYVQKDSEEGMHVFSSIKSRNGDPIAGLIIEKERKIMGVYNSNKNLNFLILTALSLSTLVGLYFCMTYFILKPLQNLLSDILNIKESKNLAAQVNISTNDEIGELAKSVNEMLSAIDQNTKLLESQKTLIAHSSKMSTLGEMAGGIAHEINSPLNAIFLKVDLAKKALQSNNSENIEKNLDGIKKTVERIAKIVKGLLMYSRDSKLDSIEVVNVSEVVSDALALCNEKIKTRNIKLECIGSKDLVLSMAPVQFSQALLNLINNASDAVENYLDKWIKIQWVEMNDSVCISVTDSGKGIPKEIREKMMNPFYTTKGVGRGTGLGLSISKGLIETLGGEIYYDEDSPNTKFIISLPKNAYLQKQTDIKKAA